MIKKIMEDKRGLQFKYTLFALVGMSLAFYAIGVWVNDWNTKYSSGLTYDLGDYEKLDEMSSYASSSKGNISVKSSFDTGDFEGTSLRGAFGVVNDIFTPFNVVFGSGGVLSTIKERWGIPNYIIVAFITLFSIAVIWSLIALFFKKQENTA